MTHDPQHRPGGHGHDHNHDHRHSHERRGGKFGAAVREVFAPHSHDASDSIDGALESSAAGIRAVKISLLALGATAAAQLVIVAISGSVALLADTIHNFSDALTAVPLWIAFALGRRAATRRYNYGFGRAEDLAGLFVIAMITLSAAIAAIESVRRLIDPVEIDHIAWVAAAGFVGFIGNELVALYRIRVGRRIGSAALVADGLHARTDGFTSLAVLLGAGGVALGFPLADPIVGLLITIAILAVLRTAVRDVFRRLMDGVDPELVDAAEEALAAEPGVKSVRSVKMRWIGHRLHADAELDIDPATSLTDAHQIAHDAEHKLTHTVPKLSTALIHAYPANNATPAELGALSVTVLSATSADQCCDAEVDPRSDVFPLLAAKDYSAPALFEPTNLLREARRQRGLPDIEVPTAGLLDPDGDIIRYLAASGRGRRHPGWACYHTEMWTVDLDGIQIGVVGMAVGAPFAVLVAEQLAASGARLVLSITSAGQISAVDELPCFVLIERALRDEGTSAHYQPPGRWSRLDEKLRRRLAGAFDHLPEPVLTGSSWTTDAPYRETACAIDAAKQDSIACVEMEAAGLYAYAAARKQAVVCFAHITNTMATTGADFEKGVDNGAHDALAVARAAAAALL